MLSVFRWIALISAIVFVVAVAGAIISSQPSLPPTKQNTAEKNPKENQTQENHKTLWDRWFPDSISLYTLFLVIFTGLLAVVGFYQLSFLGRAEGIATTTAQAAKDSAETAKQALMDVQRAFVSVTSFDGEVINREFRINAKWENASATPAIPFVDYVNWKIFPGAPPEDFSYPDLDASGNPLTGPSPVVTSFLAPKTWLWSNPLSVPLSAMEDVRDGRARLFIWGWAAYTDVFKRPHRTEFCNEVIVTGVARSTNVTGIGPDQEVRVSVSYPQYGPHNTAN